MGRLTTFFEKRNFVEKRKDGVLWLVAGLAVAYVRHGIETHWAWWDSVEQFFVYWLIHTMGLSVFIVIAGAAIGYWYEFFLGKKREGDDISETVYMILMTVLVGCVCIWIVAHWLPSGEDY